MDEKHFIYEKRQQRLLVAAILLAGITTMLNSTTVTIALPSYMSIFQVDIRTVQWVVVGYMLPLGMVMPLSGYLGSRYSYRKMFLTASAAMGICSVGCAMANSFLVLVVFRFLKGIFAGLMIPYTMTLLYQYIPKDLQPRYLGLSVLFQSVGVAIGPTIAGLLLQIASWHVLFLLNVPLIALVIYLAGKSIPATQKDTHEKVDIFGIMQISLGTGLVMIAFTNVEIWGWVSPQFLICFLTGLALMVFFIIRQFHTKHPLLNFSVLKYKAFAIAVMIQCTLAMTLGITAILAQTYFQTLRGFSSITAGLLMLVPSLVMIFANNLANVLYGRISTKILILGGLFFATVGNLGMSMVGLSTSVILLEVLFSLRYLGLGMLQMPLTNYGFSAVPTYLSGHASSLYNWAKQLAQVISTNILTVVLSLNISRYYSAAGNIGRPAEGTPSYLEAAMTALNLDYFYLTIFMLLSMLCACLIQSDKKKRAK